MLRGLNYALKGINSNNTLLVWPLCSSTGCLQCIQVRTRRRTLTPPPWIPPKEERIVDCLDPETNKLLRQMIEQEKNGCIQLASKYSTSTQESASQLNENVMNRNAEWSENSKRIGLLGRKIGMLPQWLNDGTRVLCTLIEFKDNSVVSAVDPDTWYRKSIVGKKKAFGIHGPMWKVTVGAVNADPSKFTHAYRDIFYRQGLPVKQYLGSFLVSEDAVVLPGTSLSVCHFKVGQYISVSGKTIDWGFQGGMHRWGMKGMPANRTTKSHRRIGSVGSTGDARIWPGKRMPGHMGYEWVNTSGLEVLRINPSKQVMYIKGCVPGEVNDVLLIKDCLQPLKRVRNPPFPTYFPEDDAKQQLPSDENVNDGETFVAPNGEIFASKLFRFTSPSIVFTEEDETKLPGRDKSRAKIAKLKK